MAGRARADVPVARATRASLLILFRKAKTFGFVMLSFAPLLVLVVLSLAANLSVFVVLEPLRFGQFSGGPILLLAGAVILVLGVHGRDPSRPLPESQLIG